MLKSCSASSALALALALARGLLRGSRQRCPWCARLWQTRLPGPGLKSGRRVGEEGELRIVIIAIVAGWLADLSRRETREEEKEQGC